LRFKFGKQIILYRKVINLLYKVNMKKILITGGCGFIGSNLTNYLINKGYKVYIIDNFSKNKVSKPHHNSKVYKINIKNLFFDFHFQI